MTALERELLSALDDLRTTYAQQHEIWQNEREALQRLFIQTEEQNQALSLQLKNLSAQVTNLTKQVQRLS